MSRCRRGLCTGQVNRRGLDHLDAGLRHFWLHSAPLYGEDRYQREGDRARYRSSARYRTARRRRRRLCSCQSGGREVPLRRPWREALPGHVQRLYPRWPESDPASVAGTNDIVAALKAIKIRQAPFVSRGDRSGTNQAELKLWKIADIDIATEKGPWYREIGQGMGATLNTAGAMGAYTISDRGTWIHFKNKGELALAVAGDKRLFNQYGVMLVNPQKHPDVKKELGQQFIDWLISPEGQKAIADYKINGEELFYPNAHDSGA
jgi:hypothetical protein